MTASTPLPPLATPEQWLGMQQPGTTAPPNLKELLAATSAQIRRYCGWHIAPVLTMDLLLDGSGSASQRLPSLHVVDVLSVTSDGTDLDVSTLQWSADGYMRSAGHWYGQGYWGGWTSHLRGVAVTLQHGFALEDVGDVTALCCQLATRAVSAPHGYVTGETAGATSVSYGGGAVDNRPGSMSLLGYEQALLDTYRVFGRRAA